MAPLLQSASVIGRWPIPGMSLAAEGAGSGRALAGVGDGVDRPQPPSVAMITLTQTIATVDWRMTAPPLPRRCRSLLQSVSGHQTCRQIGRRRSATDKGVQR